MRTVLDVRRFTALDMFGTVGAPRRRRIICAEFTVACPTVFLLGILTLRSGQVLLGICLSGIALNYLPLAAHALTLFRPGRLEAELAGVDVHRELKQAGAVQVLLLVPLVVAVAAAVQQFKRHVG